MLIAEARLAPRARDQWTRAGRPWGGAEPRTGRGLGLPHLIGGEGALRQARIAKAGLNFDDAAASNSQSYGQASTSKLDATHRIPPHPYILSQTGSTVGPSGSKIESQS